MENETNAAVAALEELRRELESLRSDLRSGIAGMHTDLKAMHRDMEWLKTEVVSVQRDIHHFRLFTLHDVSGMRTAMDGLREGLDRRIEQRRALDVLGERIARLERAADRTA